MKTYTDFAVNKTCELLAIPSPSGYTDDAIEYLGAEFSALGYSARKTVKGGLLVDLGGEGNGLLLEAHCDTLGGMVCEVKKNGRLRLTNIGGMNANNAEAENAIVVTRSGKKYEGTLRAGCDLRHGLIGAGVYASHGYERSHVEGVENTLKLLAAYVAP